MKQKSTAHQHKAFPLRVSTSAPKSKPQDCLQLIKSCDLSFLFPPAVFDAKLLLVLAGARKKEGTVKPWVLSMPCHWFLPKIFAVYVN